MTVSSTTNIISSWGSNPQRSPDEQKLARAIAARILQTGYLDLRSSIRRRILFEALAEQMRSYSLDPRISPFTYVTVARNELLRARTLNGMSDRVADQLASILNKQAQIIDARNEEFRLAVGNDRNKGLKIMNMRAKIETLEKEQNRMMDRFAPLCSS